MKPLGVVKLGDRICSPNVLLGFIGTSDYKVGTGLIVAGGELALGGAWISEIATEHNAVKLADVWQVSDLTVPWWGELLASPDVTGLTVHVVGPFVVTAVRAALERSTASAVQALQAERWKREGAVEALRAMIPGQGVLHAGADAPRR